MPHFLDTLCIQKDLLCYIVNHDWKNLYFLHSAFQKARFMSHGGGDSCDTWENTVAGICKNSCNCYMCSILASFLSYLKVPCFLCLFYFYFMALYTLMEIDFFSSWISFWKKEKPSCSWTSEEKYLALWALFIYQKSLLKSWEHSAEYKHLSFPPLFS